MWNIVNVYMYVFVCCYMCDQMEQGQWVRLWRGLRTGGPESHVGSGETTPRRVCDRRHSPLFSKWSKVLFCEGTLARRKVMNMHRVRTGVVLGTVLFWALTPAMACFLPGTAPTPAEMKCCHDMAAHCGKAAMPSSHSCCRVPARPETIVVQGQGNLPLKDLFVATPPKAVSLSELRAAGDASLASSESPPGIPSSSSSSVLRI